MKSHYKMQLWVLAILAPLLSGGPVVYAQDYSGYSGAELYRRFCASCHGDKGYGDGPVAASLTVETPDLTRIARRHGGSFPYETVRRIIDGRALRSAHGTRVMPVWGFELQSQAAARPHPEVQATDLVSRLTDYVRSLQREPAQ